jgi:hypothetical protein
VVGIAFSNSGLDAWPVFYLPMQALASGNFFVRRRPLSGEGVP